MYYILCKLNRSILRSGSKVKGRLQFIHPLFSDFPYFQDFIHLFFDIMKDTLGTAVLEGMDAVQQKMQLRQALFSFVEGGYSLYIDHILYVESKKHKSVFYYLKSRIVNYQIYDKPDHIEQILSRYGFLGIHKSYLVNLRKITTEQV